MYRPSKSFLFYTAGFREIKGKLIQVYDIKTSRPNIIVHPTTAWRQNYPAEQIVLIIVHVLVSSAFQIVSSMYMNLFQEKGFVTCHLLTIIFDDVLYIV